MINAYHSIGSEPKTPTREEVQAQLDLEMKIQEHDRWLKNTITKDFLKHIDKAIEDIDSRLAFGAEDLGTDNEILRVLLAKKNALKEIIEYANTAN